MAISVTESFRFPFISGLQQPGSSHCKKLSRKMRYCSEENSLKLITRIAVLYIIKSLATRHGKNFPEAGKHKTIIFLMQLLLNYQLAICLFITLGNF